MSASRQLWVWSRLPPFYPVVLFRGSPGTTGVHRRIRFVRILSCHMKHQQPQGSSMRSNLFSFSAIPPTIKWLLIANGIGFLFIIYDQSPVVMHFALWPLGHFPVAGSDQTVGFEPWQLVSYAFLHANVSHFFFNKIAK